jgi:peptidoglycan-associated lipoprotein
MNTMKLIYPLTLALAVTLAGAGCKHQPTKLTQLPASGAPPVGEPAPQTQQFPASQPIPIDQNIVNSTPVAPIAPGHFETSTNWDPSDPNLIADRATLAANTVHFAFDSAVVKTTEQSNLQAVAAALTSDLNVKLLIEGNCDERGTEEYNRSLGERRALALREALVKLNIDLQRIRTISYGKDKPVDPAQTEEAYAKNRRGDFVLFHPKPGA